MMKKYSSKRQYAYETIRSRIMNGRYGAGERLVIDQLAKELGTSSIPIREAIRQLESAGFIEYRPYSGAIVKKMNNRMYAETLTVLSLNMSYASALAADHLTEDSYDELAGINREMEVELENYNFLHVAKLNRQFHATIYRQCGNETLVEMIEQMWNRLEGIQSSGFSFVPQRARPSIEEHWELIDALKKKLPFAEIEARFREHNMKTVAAIESKLDT